MGRTVRPCSRDHARTSVVRQTRPTLSSAIGAGKSGCRANCQARLAPTPSNWAISATATTSGGIEAGTAPPYLHHAGPFPVRQALTYSTTNLVTSYSVAKTECRHGVPCDE